MSPWLKKSRPYSEYKYRFHYRIEDELIANFSTMEKWCDAHAGIVHTDWGVEFYMSSKILSTNDSCGFYFMDDEIAVQFKLIWGGSSERLVLNINDMITI